MGKVPHVTFVRKHRAAEPPLPDEIQVPLAEIAGRAKEGLLALSVGVGLQVLDAMMAGELHAKVGAKGKHNSERVAARHGRQPGRVVLGGRTVRVSRPRARTVDGGEVELQTYRAFQDRPARRDGL